jgi:tagatose 6-phosphate kinase
MTFTKVALDEVNRATSVHEYASGKSANVARVLHTLGHDVLAMGFLGGDSGKFYRSDLDRAGIPHDFVTVAPSTRLCTTVIDESTGTATELVEESKPLEARDFETLLEKLAAQLKNVDLLVLSGTLAPGANPDFYARCMKLARRDVRVILDAVGDPLLSALPLRPFVIKPNQSEVGRTLDADVDSEDALRGAMRELVSRGAKWVVVTRGRAGTLVTDGSSFWQVNTPKVKVISPIGSGDSFAAGLASALLKGDDVPQGCILAAACGSANAMTPLAGHVRREDLESLVKQIRLAPLVPSPGTPAFGSEAQARRGEG